ncbi:MAG: hypothetical protein EZS28_042105, partial [Streblomastix strix]
SDEQEEEEPRITYFLCLQDIIGLDTAIKSNLDSLWFFDKETIWYEYVRLTKQQALVLATAFYKSFRLDALDAYRQTSACGSAQSKVIHFSTQTKWFRTSKNQSNLY